MDIRQTINENPRGTAIVSGGIVVLALCFILYQIFGHSGPSAASGPDKQFFSDDDGKSYFTVDGNPIPPIDSPKHPGKPAFRAVIFKCGSGKPFVARLEKFSDDMKKQLEDARKANPGAAMVSGRMVEVRKPGEKKWVRLGRDSAEAYNNVMRPQCPDGNNDSLEYVPPS